jgi:hypothetical protein
LPRRFELHEDIARQHQRDTHEDEKKSQIPIGDGYIEIGANQRYRQLDREVQQIARAGHVARRPNRAMKYARRMKVPVQKQQHRMGIVTLSMA